MLRLVPFCRGPIFGGVAFVAISVVAIAGVVAKARRDAGDPARCPGLVAMGNRCCAQGQALRDGLCVGRPSYCPLPLAATELGCVAGSERVVIRGGVLEAGAGDWEGDWEAERRAPHRTVVAPFEIDSHEITESAYAACATLGKCADLPRSGEPGRAMAGMTRREVEAYCAFRGGRLPSDDEWTFSARGPSSRRYPWGDTGAVCRRASWGMREGPCGFDALGPELAGAHPDGATPEGLYDLAGNVAEWVAGASDDPSGMVRGGSFATVLATDLRTWRVRRLAASTRSSEVGGRCAYEALAPSN
jgi:formylglycine-generating enzyme